MNQEGLEWPVRMHSSLAPGGSTEPEVHVHVHVYACAGGCVSELMAQLQL